MQRQSQKERIENAKRTYELELANARRANAQRQVHELEAKIKECDKELKAIEEKNRPLIQQSLFAQPAKVEPRPVQAHYPAEPSFDAHYPEPSFDWSKLLDNGPVYRVGAYKTSLYSH